MRRYGGAVVLGMFPALKVAPVIFGTPRTDAWDQVTITDERLFLLQPRTRIQKMMQRAQCSVLTQLRAYLTHYSLTLLVSFKINPFLYKFNY